MIEVYLTEAYFDIWGADARAQLGDNPIAAAIAERAAAIATGDRDKLVRLAITFAQLGCPYQQARTGRIAAAIWRSG
jgi:hypothetical protein